MNLLIELRQLDVNNAGNWPIPFKAGALIILFFAIIIASYFLIIKDQIVVLETAEAQEETLKNSYLVKKRSAVNLPELRQQLKDIEQSLSTLLRQLPDKSEMEALLVDINQAGLGYHDFGAFASDVAQLPRIVTLNNISITQGNDGKLILDATAKTFRYLDDEEITRQNKGK